MSNTHSSSHSNKPNEKHLEFIQSTIQRMAQNSFQAKAWCITLLSATVAFFLTNDEEKLKIVSIIAAFAITIIFCAIDAYYLYLERGYRKLYSIAAKLETSNPPLRDYDMKIPDKSKGTGNYFKALFSTTVATVYGLIIILLSALTIYMYL